MILKQRNVPNFTRKVYGKIMTAISSKCKLSEAIDILVDEIQNLLDGKVLIEDLTIRERLKTK